MGGGPSREDILADQQFMWKVQQQQRDILDYHTQSIQTFFKSVDGMLVVKGSMAQDEIVKAQQASADEMKKAQDLTKAQAAKPKPTGTRFFLLL
jgi:hypothetical protein